MSDEPQLYVPEEPHGWDEIKRSLPNVGILSALSEASLSNLTQFGTYSTHEEGSLVIVEGKIQSRLYIVVYGKLSISAMVGGEEIFLAEAEEGECIGELSIFEPSPATATVRVIDKAILWSLDLPSLHRYLADHVTGGIALLMGLAQCLSQRIRLVNHTIAQNSLSFVPSTPQVSAQPLTYEHQKEKSGFFGILKQKMASEKKAKLTTQIKI